jgi:hypothetical protein
LAEIIDTVTGRERDMMTTLLASGIAVTPLVGIVGALWLAKRAEARRDARYARQIALTDAIHRELGAVAAPTVTQRGGGWLVDMTVPLDSPATVAAILRVTERAFAPADGSGVGPLQITLRPAPRESRVTAASAPRAAIGKPARLAA